MSTAYPVSRRTGFQSGLSSALHVALAVFTVGLVVACGDDGSDDGGGGHAGSGGKTAQGGAPGAGGSSGSPGSTLTYSQDVKPIFQSKCEYCHHPDAALFLDFEHPADPDVGIIGRENTWTMAKEKLIVDPGNVDNSFLIRKVTGTDLDAHVEGSPMPWIVPKVTAEELGAIEQWIADGANDDEFFAANVAPIFGTAIKLGAAGGKCTFCHYPGTPYHMSVLDVFDSETGMVNVTSAFGGKIVAPGDPDGSLLIKKLSAADPPGSPMPLAPARLTEAEIEKVEAWVQDGAKDN